MMSSNVANTHSRLPSYTRDTVNLPSHMFHTEINVDSFFQGPIIRISPSQIHINDRDFLDELYPGSNKPTDKDPAVSGAFGKYVSWIPYQCVTKTIVVQNLF